MGKIINTSIEFSIGEVVYLITDAEQEKRIVTGILLKPGRLVMYELACCEELSYHYDFEITNDRNILQ